MNKLFTFLILSVFLLSFVSAAQSETNHNLVLSCSGFTCSAVNVTILYPNSSTAVNNQPMTNNVYYANYTLYLPIIGQYDYFYSDGTNSSKGSFYASKTGFELNTSQIILYVFIGLVLLFLFGLSVYGGLTLPFNNQRNSEDEVISVNWRKYLKVFCWATSYMLLIGIVFVAWNLIYAYAQWEGIGNFFQYIYKLLMALALPVFVSIWVMVIVNFINDKKIEKFIKRTGVGY